MKRINILAFFVMLLVVSCRNQDVFYRTDAHKIQVEKKESKLNYSVYLIGDTGGDTLKSEPALSLLKRELNQAESDKTAVVFLGDNIYPEGMHKKDHPLRQQDESRIDAQLNAVRDFNGEIVFLPGNHDWQRGGKQGIEFIKRQEKYVQKKLGKKVFEPSDGCSGPVEIELSDALTLIVIDTQWWLHRYEKARGEENDCELRTKNAFLAEFKELLKSNRNKNVIVVGHHPLYSNGVHGGYFGWRDHLLPLTRKNPKLWIPMPIIGSIYPFYRSFFGNIQDIPNPTYQELKKQLVLAMNEYENVIYSAGHEHNLQYVKENRLHHVVSGSGSKKSALRFNQRIDFGAEKNGLAKVNVYEDGEVELVFLNGEDHANPVLFRKTLHAKDIKEFDYSKKKKPSYKGMYKTVVPDSNFEASTLKRFFFGDLNRNLWLKPLKVPYLDIHHVHGGLKPVGKGGGMQTLSLKMKGGDSYTYKLRGIKKNADFLVNRDLRGTIAQDIIYDGIAGSHPYASVAVPNFAKAAGIYYTQPQLVYVPKDSILGDYLGEFGGMFCLLEIHPNDDMSEFENFGNSKKVVNYLKAIKELEEDPKNKVDVSFTVRSRLFDLFLGDWDRHDDQWRWATFKENGERIYQPIPRDRDQVFFKFDGAVMKIANRKWLLRKFQNFDKEIRDVAGLSFNARYFDRYFLSEANREVWIEEAKKLQQQLTDPVILNSLKDLPQEAFTENGEHLFDVLRARRAKLQEFAGRYYNILSKEVNIHGTLKKDFVEVLRKENGDVEVNLYPIKKGEKVSEKRYFHRVFKRNETKEIRIYGLDNKDKYVVKGETSKSIVVRLIAGDNKDTFIDESTVAGLSKKTKIYDVTGKVDTDLSKESKLKVFEPEDAYLFDRKEFKYDALLPLPSIGVNPDDGFFIGPGFKYVKHGFKKEPYKYFHSLSSNYALRAEGSNFKYDCEYIKILGKVDFGGTIELNQPEVFQYYGQGNGTSPEDFQIGNSDVRINYYNAGTRFALSSKDLSSRFIGSVNYQIAELRKNPFFEQQFAGKKNQQFLSGELKYQYINLDNIANPSKGIGFEASASNTFSTINDEVDFVTLSSKLSFYIPLNYFKKQTVIAVRTGVVTNIGDYNFYQSAFLSGLSQMRGITRNRFAGESASYSNIELRRSFFKVKNYVAPFDFGMLAHYDLGRIWTEKIDSEKWHYSVGGGVYFNILEFITIVGTYSVSDVDEVFNLGTKFYF